MKVLIAAPVRNRAWVLPEFLDALDTSVKFAQQYLEDFVFRSYFIVNNSEDDSADILRNRNYSVVTHNFSDPTESEIRGKYSFSKLATLRNKILDYASIHRFDYVLSVDTDILLPKRAVLDLINDHWLSSNSHIVVSPLVRNYAGDHFPAHNIMEEYEPREYRSLIDFPKDTMVRVDLLGAVTLIPSTFFGCRYAQTPNGEDRAFCEDIRATGGLLYVDTRIRCTHVMEPGLYVKAGLPKWNDPQ